MPEKKMRVKGKYLTIHDLRMSADIPADIPHYDLSVVFYSNIRWRVFAIWLRFSGGK